jgi:hypothetical protein
MTLLDKVKQQSNVIFSKSGILCRDNNVINGVCYIETFKDIT